MPTLPSSSKKPWITPNKGGHRGRKRTDQDKLYHTPAWRKLRKKFITAFPICKQCHTEGRITTGTLVDHITPVKQGGAFLEWNNLQTLCNSCHAIKSGREANQSKQ